jgi:hypothetical protein
MPVSGGSDEDGQRLLSPLAGFAAGWSWGSWIVALGAVLAGNSTDAVVVNLLTAVLGGSYLLWLLQRSADRS